MKARKLIILMAILVVTSIAAAQPPDTLWTKTFGGDQYDYGHYIQQTADGGFILVGESGSGTADTTQILLIRMDDMGDTLWTKYFNSFPPYGVVYFAEAQCVQQTGDGGYIMAGDILIEQTDTEDFLLLKTDSSGVMQWYKIYGLNDDAYAYSVRQTADNGYILAGATVATLQGDYDAWLVKTDGEGDSVWSHMYGDALDNRAYSVQQTSDGGYIFAGQTSSDDVDGWLVKTDDLGVVVWEGIYGWPGEDVARCVQQTTGGGYIVGGSTYMGGQGADMWLFKTNSAGDLVWWGNFGGLNDDWGMSVWQTGLGGYVIAGYTWTSFSLQYDLMVVKADSAGNHVWTFVLGGSGGDYGQCIEQISSGDYIIAGYTSSWGNGEHDAWVVQLSDGEPAPSVVICDLRFPQPGDFALHAPFPNPFNATATIRFQLPTPSDVRLEIFDLSGRPVGASASWRTAPLLAQRLQPGIYDLPFDGSNIPSGIYLCRLTAGDFTATQKMVLLK